MKRLIVLSAMSALLAAGPLGNKSLASEPIADPAVALEKAVQIEQTTDNAAEAEAIYRQIIADHGRLDAAAAEAKYRLGAMLIEQGRHEEGRAVLMELMVVSRQSVNEWRFKAVGLLGEGNPETGVGLNPKEMQAFMSAMGVASQVARQVPLGTNPFGGGPGSGFGDPFGDPAMGNPFGFDPGMGAFGGDPAMGAFDENTMMMEAMLASRTPSQVQQAQALLNAQKYEEAANAFEAATREHPTTLQAWIGLGRAQFNLDSLHEAEAAYTEALSLAPSNSEALGGLGTIYREYGSNETAMEFWTRAVEGDPRNAEAWQGIATLAQDRGETDEAIRALNQLLQHDPRNLEARTLLQRIDPDAESAPAPRTESELAAARELAMNEGRFEDALTAEEKRLQLRIDAFNPWVDKLSFSGLAKEWAQKHKPSDNRINEAIIAVDSRIKLLAKDDPREWRFWLVMAELAEARGDSDSASKWIYNAMHRYPQRTYIDPAKHSFYQHLVDRIAPIWWSKEGREHAIQMAIHTMESDRRLQTFNVDWWLDRIAEDGGDVDFQRRFLERVIQAYDKRAEKFPDQAGIIAAEKQILRRRIEQLAP